VDRYGADKKRPREEEEEIRTEKMDEAAEAVPFDTLPPEKADEQQARKKNGKKGKPRVEEEKPAEKSNEDKLNELIEKGKKQGKLSFKDLMDVLGGHEPGSEQLDKFTIRWRTWASTRRGLRPPWTTISCPLWTSWKRSRKSRRRKLPTRTRPCDSFSTDIPSACTSRRSAR
jgi:hypothetical protein